MDAIATVIITVLSGTFVFVLGQIFLQVFLVPVQEFRKTIAAIAHARIEVADVTSNPGVQSKERNEEASRRLRALSADLCSHLTLVRPYSVVRCVFRLPMHANVLLALKSLVGLSNSVFSDSGKTIEKNAARWDKICDCLGIDIEPDDRVPEG